MRLLVIGLALAMTLAAGSLFVSSWRHDRQELTALRPHRGTFRVSREQDKVRTPDFVGETGGDDVRIERFMKEALRKFQLEQETPRLMWLQ